MAEPTAGVTPPPIEGSPLSIARTPAVFLQDACYLHRYIRSKDISSVFERPERLRAVSVGLSAAVARLDGLCGKVPATRAVGPNVGVEAPQDADSLIASLNQMKLDPAAVGVSNELGPLSADQSARAAASTPIIKSRASINISNNAAVKFVHGDIDGDIYLDSLKQWVKESADKVSKGQSEIPPGLSQGDLYLCPESINAMQGALGTVIEAVDRVISSTRMTFTSSYGSDSSLRPRAFVAIRPPGHHCGEDTPSGFCFVNNVAVAAAHAHLQHGIRRVAIFDIDLHHGNGTQSIVWQINEETYRQTLEEQAGAPKKPPGLTAYYGSIHDILSYPCEDGKPELVQAASVSIHDSHGQFVENVHLQQYKSEDSFWDQLYERRYRRILTKAEDFLDDTGGPGDDVLFFISCGMDACEHEYESMSRHGRKVPTSFYYQFARDASKLADKYAKGRIISVLEGGYSDRALISGSFAHLVGLSDFVVDLKDDISRRKEVEKWWSVENLEKIEVATNSGTGKKRRAGRHSGRLVVPPLAAVASPEDTTPDWLERTRSIFDGLDADNALKNATSTVTKAAAAAGTTARASAPTNAPSSSRGMRGRGAALTTITSNRTSTAPTSSNKAGGKPRSVTTSPRKDKITSPSSSATATGTRRSARSKMATPAGATMTATTTTAAAEVTNSDSGASLPTTPPAEDGQGMAEQQQQQAQKRQPKVVLKLGREVGA